ncbi:TonB-dependent siderophore receptor protein [Pseudomonas sp. StFLB209]|uniref:TonB-dependent siderophore receptor n=1 Tax=Pseudomonas sp. StFLB209 TaxID=1028989 RepID=UPI0004F6B8BE|nr:TonB-dependent siderophore receptor [Pseudomonas sp. StFLB209]BAP45350.1 TonB-dependent siderophore receptor protein [Pseudomonas sp. StFLB209]
MHHPSPFSPIALALALAFGSSLASADSLAAPADISHASFDFDLPAGPLDATLTAIARQSGRNIAFSASLTRGLNSPALRGRYSAEQAVQQALQGLALQLGVTPSGTLSIEPRSDAAVQLAPIDIAAASHAQNAWGPAYSRVATHSASATKTDTPLLETPQSVSIITREEMTARQHTSLADVLNYTPGVIAQPNGYSRVADDYRMRGFDIGPRTGSVLRDGMKMQSTQFEGGQEPYGLERVEVLKGASSVLYGQLAPGGLVNTVSKRPTLTPLHELNLEYGNHQRMQLSTDHAGALDEQGRLSYRLTALSRDSGTQYSAIDDDKHYIAPALTWQISDDSRLTLLASQQRTRTTLTPPMRYDLTVYSRTPGYKVPYDLFAGEPDYDRYDGNLHTAGYLFEHRVNEHLQLRQAVRYFESRADYDYITLNTSRVSGANLSQLSRSYNSREDIATGWTSDNSLQLDLEHGRWQHTVLAGVDYYHKTYDSHRFSGNAPVLDLANPVYGNLPNVDRSVDRGSDLHARQLGLYLQEQIKFDEHWVGVFGLRQDWADSTTRTYREGARSTTDDSQLTGRVGVVYLAGNGLAAYASYSQSFLPASGSGADGKPFKPTEGEQYEIGLRYQPADREWLLSAALYQLTQRNVTSSIPGSDFDEQTGKERSKGLELEAKAQLTDNLAFSAGYAYTDAHVIADNDPQLEGSRIEGTPYHSASLWLDYRLAALGLHGVSVGAGARYNGTTHTLPSISDRKIPAYTLFDARLSYALDDHWQLAVRAQNLTNQRYLYCANSCRYGDERSLVGSVSYNW